MIFRKYIRELVAAAVAKETQRLESYYEMAREARSVAIQALSKAESLDVTKAYLWRQSEIIAPSEPGLTQERPLTQPDFLEGLDETYIKNREIDDDF